MSVVSDDPGGDVDELLAWLAAEPELRGHVRPTAPQIEHGQMGGLPEIIVAIVSAGGVATVLANSLTTYIQNQSRRIEVKVRTDSGLEVHVTANRVEDLQSLLSTLAEE